MSITIEKRQKTAKEVLLEQLKKTPIIEVACQKVGIGRATYYRWRKEDEQFTQASDQAKGEGELLINDMAESQLISAIKEKNLTAIIFWLKNHHPTYGTKIEITTNKLIGYKLSPEQEELVHKALDIYKSEQNPEVYGSNNGRPE